MKPLHFLFVTASVLLAAATACIKEDLSACRSKNELILSYKGDGATEIFKDKVRMVEIFVFDSKGNLVYSGVLPQSDVDRAKTVLPTLDPGTTPSSASGTPIPQGLTRWLWGISPRPSLARKPSSAPGQ